MMIVQAIQKGLHAWCVDTIYKIIIDDQIVT